MPPPPATNDARSASPIPINHRDPSVRSDPVAVSQATPPWLQRLATLPPHTLIRVDFTEGSGPLQTWYGTLHEPKKRGDSKRWDVVYRLADEGAITVITSTIPPTVEGVAIVDVAPIAAWPPELVLPAEATPAPPRAPRAPTRVAAKPAVTHATSTPAQTPQPIDAATSQALADQPDDHHDNQSDDEPEELDDKIREWSGENFPKEAILPFRLGNGAQLPAVAHMQGSHLIQLLGAPPAQPPSLALRGLVKTTHAEHRRMLRRLANMDSGWHLAPLTTAIIEFLTTEKRSRKWAATTMLKQLCTAQGALALLPMHRQAPPIHLADCPTWRQAMRAATIASKQMLPAQPQPATWAEVTHTLDTEPSLPVFCAILLAWMTCARVGCVLQLRRNDVEIHKEGTLSVRFRRGKSVRTRGPYTVHTTTIPPRYLARLERWLNQRRNTMFDASTTGEQVKLALRRTNPLLEQRSLRRGSIQTLACSEGITDETLMLFSGHTQVTTLRRYLSWGKAATHTRETMTRAARNILTGPAPSVTLEEPHGSPGTSATKPQL